MVGLAGTLSITLLAVLGAQTVNAQGIANNSLEQTPCVVGAYLEAQCNSGTFTINPLEDGYHYIGPTNDTTTQNDCICSSVVYQLISACGACQNRTFISYSNWAFYCPPSLTAPEGTYPEVINSGTRVPAWAYIKPSTYNDFFNVTGAMNVGDSPESSQTPSSTSSTPTGKSTSLPATTTGTGGAGGGSVSPTSTTASSSPTSSSGGGGGGGSSHTGAIAGGVVGGVLGLALLALLGFFCVRRKNNNNNAAASGTTGQGGAPEMANYGAAGAGAGAVAGGGYTGVPSSVPGSPNEYPQTHYTGQTGPSTGYQPSTGYYNPNDASTYAHTPVQSAYAPTPAPGGYGNQAFPAPQGGAGQGYYGEPQQAGRYSGMPEV